MGELKELCEAFEKLGLGAISPVAGDPLELRQIQAAIEASLADGTRSPEVSRTAKPPTRGREVSELLAELQAQRDPPWPNFLD